jgi:hypothetical protein
MPWGLMTKIELALNAKQGENFPILLLPPFFSKNSFSDQMAQSSAVSPCSEGG